MLNGFQVVGIYSIEVYRANGTVERMGGLKNLVPDTGSEQFAKKLLDEQTSKMAYMAVGTATAAAALGDTTLPGEAGRKALSLNASSQHRMVQVATFGGAADTLTGVALTEVGIFNRAESGFGTIGSRLVFSSSAVTLAASDLVKFEVVTTVGSHT